MNKKKIIKTVILAVTFVTILVTAILSKLEFIRLLPLLISVFIMMFQSEANRYGYLAGGLNSLLYAFVFVRIGLYASAASAALFSCPMQILTFLYWNKKSYKSSTVFKKMSLRLRVISSVAFVAIWAAVFVVLRLLGSSYAVLDNTSSLLGIVVSILTMLAYIEYSYIWIISSVISIFLNIQVAISDMGHITYVVYSVYCLYCTIAAVINVAKLYKVQQGEGKKADLPASDGN